jgi:hypothetical protein
MAAGSGATGRTVLEFETVIRLLGAVRFDFGLPRRYFVGDLILFVLWAAMVVAAMNLTPDPSGHGTHRQFGLPPCALLALTGRECPSCGLTTSFAAVVHGDLALAFRAHALGPILFALMAVYATFALSKFLFRYRVVLPYRTVLFASFALLVVYLGYGFARMALG